MNNTQQRDKSTVDDDDYMKSDLVQGYVEQQEIRRPTPSNIKDMQIELAKAEKAKQWTKVTHWKREIRKAQELVKNMAQTKKILETSTMKQAENYNDDDDDDKGLNLLLKMGYKMGTGLGKKEQGAKEPIKVDLTRIEMPEYKRAGIGVVKNDEDAAYNEMQKIRQNEQANKARFLNHAKRKFLKRKRESGADYWDKSDDEEEENNDEQQQLNEEEISLEEPEAKKIKLTSDDDDNNGDDSLTFVIPPFPEDLFKKQNDHD